LSHKENDRLLFKVFFEKETEKENKAQEEDQDDALVLVGNIMHFLGKTKVELESHIANAKGGEQSEYEVHLQRLEAQIRDHIRVDCAADQIEQQLKLYAESLQAKVDEFERTGEPPRQTTRSSKSETTDYVILENKHDLLEKDNQIHDMQERIEKMYLINYKGEETKRTGRRAQEKRCSHRISR